MILSGSRDDGIRNETSATCEGTHERDFLPAASNGVFSRESIKMCQSQKKLMPKKDFESSRKIIKSVCDGGVILC